jgi:hypothetical protein
MSLARDASVALNSVGLPRLTLRWPNMLNTAAEFRLLRAISVPTSPDFEGGVRGSVPSGKGGGL